MSILVCLQQMNQINVIKKEDTRRLIKPIMKEKIQRLIHIRLRRLTQSVSKRKCDKIQYICFPLSGFLCLNSFWFFMTITLIFICLLCYKLKITFIEFDLILLIIKYLQMLSLLNQLNWTIMKHYNLCCYHDNFIILICLI